MITIYEKNAQDFSTLGLGTLEPVLCEIEEQAGGLYELVLRQPITDDNRAFLLAADRIIKAPAPMRETPQITIDGSSGESVTREIWQVNTGNSRLHLRAKPNGKIIGAYPSGTKVVKYGESSVAGWWGVIVCEGGAKGYMYADYLKYVGTETEVIRGDTPGTVVQPRQTREQLFRIYSVVNDSEGRFVEAKARHISYDLMGVVVNGKYQIENVSARTACSRFLEMADHDCGISIICGIDGDISGDFSGKNLIACLLEPETGIAAQTGAKVIRDNFEIFLVPDEERDRGVEIRYGKNLLSAQLEQDMSDIVTRIIPVGSDKEGEDLYGAPVDSAHIGEYPIIRTAVVEYDVAVDDKTTEQQALAKLQEMALADFEAGCDLPTARLDAKFVRLELSEEYAALANEYALHLYDSVPVIDHGAGIDVKVRMVGYTFDALKGKYEETRLGEISEISTTIYGYELANGSIGGTKIANGTITGGKLRDLSVGYAKITSAAIEQLSADAVVAIRADIRQLVAGSITADQLYADLASIAAAQITAANIEKANIDWAQIETLAAQIALVAKAEIAMAEIDWAQIVNAKIEAADIEDLEATVAEITRAQISRAEIDGAQIKNASIDTAKIALGAITQALIAQGAIGTAQIADGSITEAKIVSLNADVITAGTLSVERLLLRGENGLFRAINATDGSLTVEQLSQEEYQSAISGTVLVARSVTADKIAAKSITANEILSGTITAAEINVASLFAAEAVIGEIESIVLRTETIEALKGELNLWAEEKIGLAVQGKADAGDVDALKAQMALVPGQITAEVSGALESYTPTQVIDGSRLIITKDQFSIDTPLLRVNVSGVDGDMMLDMFGLSIAKVNSPNVHAQYDGPTGLTVGGVVDGEKVFATLADAFAKLNGRHIPARVAITMAADTVEEAELRQTTGASVVILGNGHTVSGRVTLSDVPNRFYMYDLKINNGSTADCLYLTSSGPAMLENCVFTANSYTAANAYGNGLQALESQAEANGCTFNGGYAGVFATTNSRVFLQSCKGEQNKYGIYARNNASVGVLTSRPNGDTGVYCRADSVVRGASDAGSGSDSAVVTPTVTTTAALTLTASRTHDGGGWYSGTNVIAQGKTSDGGNYKGCMWFDVSAISGKTIKAATLTLYRNAGVGSGNNVTVRIGTMSNTGPSGGVATVTANDVVVGTVGQKEWLSVSTAEIVAAVQQMASGAAKGLYIWGPAAAYANFAGYGSANAPGLTVTYQ
ncbi:MAG: hypothetical protein E7321_05275 [Clostridiales bacterium]|nr:hypothetical protein [Clostridiales bacterium]